MSAVIRIVGAQGLTDDLESTPLASIKLEAEGPQLAGVNVQSPLVGTSSRNHDRGITIALLTSLLTTVALGRLLAMVCARALPLTRYFVSGPCWT